MPEDLLPLWFMAALTGFVICAGVVLHHGRAMPLDEGNQPALPRPEEPAPEAAPRVFAPYDMWKLRRPHPIQITYQDADGWETEREIEVRTYALEQDMPGALPFHFKGFCATRKATRTFNVERVMQAFDLTDGTEITDLPRWLLAQPAKRRPRPEELGD